MKVKFLFDYLSPFAYFAWKKLPDLKKRLTIEIEPIPVLLPALLKHWEQKGPAEIPPKAKYIYAQCLRYAAKNNIPFTRPLYHPFNPITSLRLSLVEVSGVKQCEMIDAIWNAGWQQGQDLSNKEVLAEVITHLGLLPETLLEKTNTIQIKDKLKQNTLDAIELGVFGVPTFITEDNTLFWGLDSMDDLENHLCANY